MKTRTLKTVARVMVFLFLGSLAAEEALAQRRARGRSRGSVRHARPDGTRSRGTRGGGRVTSTQTTQGNRRTNQTTATGRGGQSATGTREVTRDGDTVTVDRRTQASTGASREVSREIEVDDGRVKQVQRESQATGRFGETIERERQIERDGAGIATFEGEARTSAGREADIEGVAARGYYGRRGVVADVDTKYYGDRTVVAGRGRYGSAVARLPQGYRPYSYYGRSYYGYGSAYYRPYYWGGSPYYFMVPPPYGVLYTTVPVGAVMIALAGSTYYYADHVCYRETHSQGSVGYEVVPAPAGLPTTTLPPERATATADGVTYAYYKNTFYRSAPSGGYVAVAKPQAVQTVEALPAEFEIEQAPNGTAYFAHEGVYYLPYLDPAGQEVYIVVDPPAPATSDPTATAGADVNVVERTLAVPSGTVLSIRTATELSSDTSPAGQRFSGFLEGDLTVGEILAAPRGSTVYGRVVESVKAGNTSGQSALTLSLTDIDVNGRIISLSTSQHAVQGASQGRDTTKKIAGGALLGTVIGAIADGGQGAAIGAAVGAGAGTATVAATSGAAATVPAQTSIQFTLQQPLSVPIVVRVTVDSVGAN